MTRKQQAIKEALRRYGEKMLAEEKARGTLPDEQTLLDQMS
jgi:hypothetical protein